MTVRSLGPINLAYHTKTNGHVITLYRTGTFFLGYEKSYKGRQFTVCIGNKRLQFG